VRPLSCFVFYSSAVHRVLPSFPTRRSSDLRTFSLTNSVTGARRRGVNACELKYFLKSDSQGIVFMCFKTAHIDALVASANSGRRSEEHTSELQSRENLVCRLLLEKKK